MIIGKNLETIFSAVRDGINRLVYGKQPIGTQVTDLIGTTNPVGGNIYTLTVPPGSTEAWIILEIPTGSSNTLAQPVARYSVTATAPINGTSILVAGFPLYASTLLVIKGADALYQFKLTPISTTLTSNNVVLKVIYWK